jgi:hypothetical protein
VKLGLITSIVTVLLLMVWYEWPKFEPGQKKEKAAFIAFTAAACLLAVLIEANPDIPSPNDWVEWMLKPLGKLLEG